MVGLASIEAIYIALVFLVPGYVFLAVRNQFVAGQDRLLSENILAFVTYSAVNFALFGWIIYLIVAYRPTPFLVVIGWALLLIIIPAVLGVLGGISTQREIAARVYALLGLRPIHPTPRAWEHVFHNSRASWVFITLKSGTEFAGFWGGESFASSDSKERDIYISEIFEFSGEKPWKPTGKGLFIAAGEIRTIEFIPLAKDHFNE